MTGAMCEDVSSIVIRLMGIPETESQKINRLYEECGHDGGER